MCSATPSAATGARAWGDVWMPSYAPTGGFVAPVAPVAADGSTSEPVQHAQAEAESVAARIVEAAGVTAEPIGEVGDAARAILNASVAHRADVIVVGSHERGWFSRLWHTPTAEEVTRASALPVLVVS
jgi:nucleotide-binding universal stress UspA family protein